MAYDIIVVGARCAGSPLAMLLARKGYRVLLVDKTSFPSDTISTHYIQGGLKRSSQHNVLAHRRYWSKASAGVFHPRAFRGLELRVIATAAMSSALCARRSVPFGKYWRSRPLVFSLVPRCQGLRGSQK